MFYPVYQSERTRAYFIHRYVPMSNFLRRKHEVSEIAPFDPWPLAFKFHNRRAAVYGEIVEALKIALGANSSVGIPPALGTENNIQRLCNQDVQLLPEFARRRKHKTKMSACRLLAIESCRVHVQVNVATPAGLRVLLVDDIASSGDTLATFETLLQRHGVKCVGRMVVGHGRTPSELRYLAYVHEELFLPCNWDLQIDSTVSLEAPIASLPWITLYAIKKPNGFCAGLLKE